MPIKVQNDLPARDILEKENIFVVDENRALHQDIRSLQICILNLMPLKEDTELQLLRSMSNTPLQIDVSFMQMSSHHSSNTSPNHLNRFYNTFDELRDSTFDGLIITGAPVEQLDFDQVDYWDELCRVFDWSKTNVTSTFHICWGAQAGIFYHYGIDKRPLSSKRFGIFEHRVMNRKVPLVRGFDDVFFMPHSRHTETPADKIHECEDLYVLAESEIAGVFLCMNRSGSQIFVMGHAEYDRLTLDSEYKRDRLKGLEIEIPINYYPYDNPENRPELVWRSHANNLYSNWLNYYVYQNTPYKWGQILDEEKRHLAHHGLTQQIDK